MDKNAVIGELWRRGVLDFKLSDVQKKIKRNILEDKNKISVVLCSRRLGKSFLMCTMALEQCLKKPHSIVKFVFPKQKDAKTNIKPLMREITEDCPEDIKPYYKEQDKMFEFPNGSQIQLAGSDNGNIDSIRGGRADLCLVDEAGFVDDLKYGIRSVLSPTTKTTKGRIVMASTPSRDPNHEFITEFVRPYMAEDRINIFTIYDNPNFDEEIIQETIDEYPLGVEDPDFKREYLCELSERADEMVIPELTPEREQTIFTSDIEIPPYYDPYVGIDIGFVDLTVALFGYYDFKKATLVILDELVIEGMNTEQLANGMLEKERELFKDPQTGFSATPYLRVCDNNLIVINDLQKLHGINVVPTAKDKKEAAINSLRITFANDKIRIHERCKTLKYHLKMAEWNNRKNDFKRIKDSTDGSIKGGHADACFVPGSTVITSKGVRNIEDVLPGDKVLTHTGGFKKVLNTMKKSYSGIVNKLKFAGREEITCTPEHRFNVAEYKRTNKNDGITTGQLCKISEGWVASEEIKVSESFKKTRHASIFPKIETSGVGRTLEECFTIGYWVAKGNVVGNGFTVEFSGHKDEVNVKEILQKYLDQKRNSTLAKSWKKKGRGSYWKTVNEYFEGNRREYTFSHKELHTELKGLGKSNYKKFPDWIYNLDQDQAFYMLCGYLFGDGYFAKSGIKSSTISRDIAYGVLSLCSIMGIGCNIRKQDMSDRVEIYPNGTISRRKDIYENSFSKEATLAILDKIRQIPQLSKIFDNKKIHKINNKRHPRIEPLHSELMYRGEEQYNGYVYNLEVEGDNSYTVNGCSVHNCDALLYLHRNVITSKNPYPIGYDQLTGENIQRSYHERDDKSSVKKFMDAILNRK